MKTIIPSLIAKNQKELDTRFAKVKHFDYFQLDIMDGKFVDGKSLIFDFKLPPGKKYEAHLMVLDPFAWIEKNFEKVEVVIFHIETTKTLAKTKSLINFIRSKNKMVGIALNPYTNVSEVSDFINEVDLILVMSVQPGKYGAKFLPSTIDKVAQLRKMNARINIEVDGSINDKTIEKVSRVGASSFVVGSYLQNSQNVVEDFRKLQELI